MSNNLAKSPEMLQKEARIEELRKALKKAITTLKRLKTRLANTKQEVSDIQMKFQTEIIHRMEEMNDLRLAIVELANKLKKLKSLSKSDREQLALMAEQFEEESLGEGFDEYQEQKVKAERGEFNFEENARAKMNDMFQEFHVEPDEKEQRNIRKIFIKLSQKFHPDRAKNKQEAEEFHKLQQDINAAYKSGDIQKLFEIERLYMEVEVLDYQSKAVTTDMLQEEINRLKNELQLIENQVDRTSRELKNLRKSGLGEMLTSVNKAEREGEGLSEQTQEMDVALDMMRAIKEAFADTLKLGYLSPKLEEVTMKMMMQHHFQEGIEDLLEDFDFFDDDEEEEDELMQDIAADLLGALSRGEEVDLNSVLSKLAAASREEWDEEPVREPLKRPKFKIGSSVRAKGTINSPVVLSVSHEGWEGRIAEAYKEDGKKGYQVRFDSQTIAAMPKKYIENCKEEGYDFGAYDFGEEELEKSKPRDTEEQATEAFRRIKHDDVWQYSLPKKDIPLMLEILFQLPGKSDIENWMHYFEKHLPLPAKAKARGKIGMYDSDTKVKILAALSYDADDGFIVLVESEHGRHPYPLMDLKAPSNRSSYAKALNLYETWFDDQAWD